MRRTLRRYLIACVGMLGCAVALRGADQAQPDLSDYKSVATAQTASLVKGKTAGAGLPAYLGVVTVAEPAGKLKVADVEPGSAAAKAGLKSGDRLARIDGKSVGSPEALRELRQ